ncbi:hypothetical protein HELRODRAFT_168290 [Helobdella robusta]|uniref:Uncharacterized protein n=1 Tax=Helobdella robusta TaxID=6412 RepID=T1F0E6_HELRO|nr:hypothetical protein HELRODRAFT_168290 [Helobdella robusta]ESO09323.1 hypothetical protein HELRODRAFT_168290 [Helobdella robusta]
MQSDNIDIKFPEVVNQKNEILNSWVYADAEDVVDAVLSQHRYENDGCCEDDSDNEISNNDYANDDEYDNDDDDQTTLRPHNDHHNSSKYWVNENEELVESDDYDDGGHVFTDLPKNFQLNLSGSQNQPEIAINGVDYLSRHRVKSPNINQIISNNDEKKGVEIVLNEDFQTRTRHPNEGSSNMNNCHKGRTNCNKYLNNIIEEVEYNNNNMSNNVEHNDANYSNINYNNNTSDNIFQVCANQQDNRINDCTKHNNDTKNYDLNTNIQKTCKLYFSRDLNEIIKPIREVKLRDRPNSDYISNTTNKHYNDTVASDNNDSNLINITNTTQLSKSNNSNSENADSNDITSNDISKQFGFKRRTEESTTLRTDAFSNNRYLENMSSSNKVGNINIRNNTHASNNYINENFNKEDSKTKINNKRNFNHDDNKTNNNNKSKNNNDDNNDNYNNKSINNINNDNNRSNNINNSCSSTSEKDSFHLMFFNEKVISDEMLVRMIGQ